MCAEKGELSQFGLADHDGYITTVARFFSLTN